MTVRTDLRGRRQPADARTHIDRINDWKGSDSWVEGARRDPGDTPMPQGERRRYRLTAAAFDGMHRLPPNSIVELTAGQVGPHHAHIDGEEYPEDHIEAHAKMQGRVPRQRTSGAY